ncbi:MAG: LysM domain [Actinomycetota bacterium]
MFLRGRLQWSLLIVSLVSGILAVVTSRSSDSESASETTVVESTIPASTTTSSAAPVLYTVQMGDSLFQIAKTYNLNMKELMDLNGITDPDKVYAGQVLQLPAATGFVGFASSTTMEP